MHILKELEQRDLAGTGRELHSFAAELYPICRSITGDGIRRTLALIQNRIPLKISEVPTGTQVFDWTVPKEWNIRDAYIKDSSGTKVVDFRQCNLHVLNYSTPVHATMPLKRTQGPSVHASRTSGLDSLSNVVLQTRLGILPIAQRSFRHSRMATTKCASILHSKTGT